MVFLRDFRFGNRYISHHALLLIRFYLAQFYYLGLMRLRYERARNRLHLTEYSVTISRMISLPFAYFLSLALLHPYKLLMHWQPYFFACVLLLQPRHVYERRVRLMNRFLQLAGQLYRRSRRKLKLSWLLILQLAIKFLSFRLIYVSYDLSRAHEIETVVMIALVFTLPVTLTIWLMDMSQHLVSIGLTLLIKSFDILDDEMAQVMKMMSVHVIKAQYGQVRQLHRRLRILQHLYLAYGQLTQQLLNCWAPQLFLIIVYNITLIYSLSSAHWKHLFSISLLIYSLLMLFKSLDNLVCLSRASRQTSWRSVAKQLEFDQLLAQYCWLERRRIGYGYVQHGDTCGQIVRRSWTHPRLKVLGLLTPNRKLFFRLLFAYFSYLHLHFMWKRMLPVVKKEIFLSSEIEMVYKYVD
ncbi:uncharacterized protein Grl58a [Drosophila tropicalis]|uniref:uncharacterized protein Grl58a n=1 Tax=Drosophila tropicalis TaxID=46794 RepID=UPI0035AC1241